MMNIKLEVVSGMTTCSFVGVYRFVQGGGLPPSSGRTKKPGSFSDSLVIPHGRTEPHCECITNRAARFIMLDEIKKNEMGSARRTYGKQESCIKGFCWGSGGRDRLEDFGVDWG